MRLRGFFRCFYTWLNFWRNPKKYYFVAKVVTLLVTYIMAKLSFKYIIYERYRLHDNKYPVKLRYQQGKDIVFGQCFGMVSGCRLHRSHRIPSEGVGDSGHYWTTTPCKGNAYSLYLMTLGMSFIDFAEQCSFNNRADGFNVRCVRESAALFIQMDDMARTNTLNTCILSSDKMR